MKAILTTVAVCVATLWVLEAAATNRIFDWRSTVPRLGSGSGT